MSTHAQPQAVDAWLDFCKRLYAQNQFSIKLGLENMQAALAQLDAAPRPKLVILVAGTNGKGTTASALSALLCAHGLKVGLYTSPHLVDLRERFRVNGQALSQALVLERGLDALARFGDPDTSKPCLTFFELTTIMAVSLFAQAQVDVAIYEVGLGGRLDATNALDPDLSIICTIGLDHQQYLGDTLTLIAAEKAAIARAGRPVLIGPQEHAEAASALDALLPWAERFLNPARPTDDSSAPRASFGVDDGGQLWTQAHRVDLGELAAQRVQSRLKHYATALRACELALELLSATSPQAAAFDEGCARAALGALKWHGRFDRRTLEHEGQPIEVIMDAAHNPDGAQALLDWLGTQERAPAVVVFGAMADKDLRGLAKIARSLDAKTFGVLIQNPRAADARTLFAALEDEHAPSSPPQCGTMAQVMPWALSEAALRQGPILVYGSIYMLGELMQWAGWDALSVHPETP